MVAGEDGGGGGGGNGTPICCLAALTILCPREDPWPAAGCLFLCTEGKGGLLPADSLWARCSSCLNVSLNDTPGSGLGLACEGVAGGGEGGGAGDAGGEGMARDGGGGSSSAGSAATALPSTPCAGCPLLAVPAAAPSSPSNLLQVPLTASLIGTKRG